MATSRKKQDEKNLKTLRELGALPQNKYCFDCNQRGPTYVNVTIGSFVCTKCSGMLRGLTPPHRVKSISMATFNAEEVEVLKNRGNDYCKSVWLGLHEGDAFPKDEQSIRDLMVDKYERKRFYMDPSNHLQTNAKMRNGYAKPKPLNGLVSDAKPIKITNGTTTTETNRKRPEVLKSAGAFTVDFNNADIFALNNKNSQNNAGGKLESFANFDDNPVFDNSNNNANNTGMPTSFDSFNLTQPNNNNMLNNNKSLLSSPPQQPPPPQQDKYAALKDLDNELKSQQSATVATDWNSSGSNGSLYSSSTPTGSMYSSPSPQNSMFGSPSQGQFMNNFAPPPNQDVSSSTFSNPFNGNGFANWGTNMNNYNRNVHQQQQPIANPFRSEHQMKLESFGNGIANFHHQPPMFPMATNGWPMNPFKVEAGANINSNNPFL